MSEMYKNIKLEDKPEFDASYIDGNIFALGGAAGRILKQNGMREYVNEMYERINNSQSYEDALCVIGDYVNFI